MTGGICGITPLASKSSEEQDRRASFALESAGLGVWDADLVRGTCYYSTVWKSMLGYSEDEIGTEGDVWLQLVHPDDRERAIEAGRAHEDGVAPIIETEFRLRHKQGHWVWVLDRGKVIERDGNGRPTRMIGVQTDITRQKNAEHDLALLNERIRLATEAGGVGLWHWDIDAGHLSWDARMHELYGSDPKTVKPSPADWISRLHPDDAEEAQRLVDDAIRTDSPFTSTYRIVRPSGDVRHIRALARLVRREDAPAIMVGTAFDVTDQMIAAKALADEKERLRITLQSIGDGVLCTDTECRITFVNAAAERLLQCAAADILGAGLDQVFSVVREDTGEPLAPLAPEAIRRAETVEQREPALLARRDGSQRSIRDLASPIITSDGEVVGSVLVMQDVTQARAMQRDLAHAATHDTLTGLKSRAAFEKCLADAIEDARTRPTRHALLFVDLDRFKIVNDTAGHAAGDTILKVIATALKSAVHARDIVARLGGDEFAVLLLDCDGDNAERVANRILGLVADCRVASNGKTHQVGASIGLSVIDDSHDSAQTILAQADVACYAAKTSGRNRLSVFTPDAGDAPRHLSDIRVAAGIRDAIQGGRFRLYAQEIRDLQSPLRTGCRYEILTRMVGLDGSIILPGAFIPAAERFDLMGDLDRWVIRTTVCDYGARLMADPDRSVAVNLSANSLSDPDLWPFVEATIAEGHLHPSRLTFEITETSVINNFVAAERFVASARHLGCRISLDDFGSGVSSFAYLKRFPVDSIKIDQSFVRAMHDSPYDRLIVRLIGDIARELGVEVIAEGIEQAETVDALRSIGIDIGQGFLFHRPRPLDEIVGTEAGRRRVATSRVR